MLCASFRSRRICISSGRILERCHSHCRMESSAGSSLEMSVGARPFHTSIGISSRTLLQHKSLRQFHQAEATRLQYFFIPPPIHHNVLQVRVLVLQLLGLLRFARVHRAIFCFPGIDRVLRYHTFCARSSALRPASNCLAPRPSTPPFAYFSIHPLPLLGNAWDRSASATTCSAGGRGLTHTSLDGRRVLMHSRAVYLRCLDRMTMLV